MADNEKANNVASNEPTAIDGVAANQAAAPLALPLQVPDVPTAKSSSSPSDVKSKGGFFHRSGKHEVSDKEKQLDRGSASSSTDIPPADLAVPSVEEHLGPVGFFDLFRYATKAELAMNAVGIACAIASGAAQVSDEKARAPGRLSILRLTPHNLFVAVDVAVIRQPHHQLRQLRHRHQSGRCELQGLPVGIPTPPSRS